MGGGMEKDDIDAIISSLAAVHNKIDNIESLISSALPAEYCEPEEVHQIWRSITSKAR